MPGELEATGLNGADEAPRGPGAAGVPEAPVPLARLRARAAELGLDVGVTLALPGDEAPRLRQFVADGWHGVMDYLERAIEARCDPRVVLPGARSVVVVAVPYGDGTPRDPPPPAGAARIARYARSKDYHGHLLDRLRRLRAVLEDPLARVFVDAGPVPEKPFAERAGLGWLGKHTNLVSRSFGSWFHLGAVVTRREIEATPAHPPRCGTCDRCLHACPTGALRPDRPFRLDPRLCTSYLTIEVRGPLAREDRPRIGEWVFGCDLCLDACPWNRFAQAARDARLSAAAVANDWTPEALLGLDDAAFSQVFRGTPLVRAGRTGLLRNAAVVLGNRGDRAAVPRLARVLAEEHDPVVRGHAAWSLGRLGGDEALRALAAVRDREGDRSVLEEVEAAIEELTETLENHYESQL